MIKASSVLVMAALMTIPAGLAGAHPLSRHGGHHAGGNAQYHGRMSAANAPQQRFEVKINAMWCGPATAAAAPKWCGG